MNPEATGPTGQPRRMRVLHVMTRMAVGGAERQLIGVLRAAHGRLWDAHLCVLYPDSPLTAEVAEFMPVTELRPGPRWDPRRPVELRRLVHRLAPDVVHPTLWGASWFTRLALAWPNRPPIVMSEQRVEDDRSPAARRLDAALRPLTDAWIGNSKDVVDFILRAHGAPADRVTCILNGIDRAVFHPRTGPRPPGGPRIGGVGRLIPVKSFDIAIAAMPHILDEFPDATLRIAGGGPERDALRAAGEGLPVELVGLLPRLDDVAEFLRGLDVFVLPSRYEGLPNAVLEAQACGVPVVVTQVPGMAEAVGPGTRLVPPGNPKALAEAVLDVLRGGPPGNVVIPQSFDDVATQHLAVFEAARRHRGAGRASSPAS